MAEDSEVGREQSYLDLLYARLDLLRARTAEDLAAVRREGPSGTPQNRSERDAFATLHEQRLAQLEAVEDRLAFGRIDLTDGDRRYIGRLGLSDEERTQLLVDWRAPAARSFYQATAAAPHDVVRRRHFATRGRSVVGVEDEVLDLDALPEGDRSTLAGEGALMAAVGARRTGRMADIVATIQAEQDRVIRSDLTGALVVQGGPGTGKTAVALHRAAYLLYTHRERLARSGVLLVGPNPLFLRYIEQVLPSLGETGVVMSTAAELFPGVSAVEEIRPGVAALKGDLRMARVLDRAVRDRQRVPDSRRKLVVEGTTLELAPERVAAARGRARRTRKPHNMAREGFLRDLLDQLAGDLARAIGTDLDADSREDLLSDLRDSADVRRELNLAWMPLDPRRTLADLFADPDRLAVVAPDLTSHERRLLHRERGSAWTVADVPLLDELAELLGEDGTADRLAAHAAQAARMSELEHARDTLSMGVGSGLVSAEQLADRFADSGPTLTVAERAESDRTWAYGHLVVDEAQELSPMMWRLLMRRVPSRSLTLVGDVAQVGSPAGTSSWATVLDPYVAGRWRLEELTVNYRTPAQVMRVAADTLAAAGVSASTPESVREGDSPPAARRIAAGDLVAVVDAVRSELGQLGAGRLAVVTVAGTDDALRDGLAAALPPGTVGRGRATLDSPVSVLAVPAVKGLEFDGVIVVEPADILAGSPRGANDLYVALTRPTQRLLVLHSADLPPGMDALTPT
ncbi:MAG: AAA family ATPase [Spirochaetaceae bacterium]|nr:AAA family ATPase [Spirochaetaceae bacterium]